MSRIARKSLLMLAILSIGWMALAVARQQLIASRAAQSLGITRKGFLRGSVSPGEASVEVPLVPLLFNPFAAHPKAYLIVDDLPRGEIRY